MAIESLRCKRGLEQAAEPDELFKVLKLEYFELGIPVKHLENLLQIHCSCGVGTKS